MIKPYSVLNIFLFSLSMPSLKYHTAISKAIQKHTGKPEAYIAVSINDNASLIWAGSDAPAALGTMCSIGAISVTSNGGITKDVTELLEPFGLAADRIYINFFDIPRANCGWNKATFAG
jgi:phenylpyruvate tautomerase